MAAVERIALDNALKRVGTSMVLRRVVGKPPNDLNIDCNVRGFAKSGLSAELTAQVPETPSLVIISPTDISDAQWPGGNADTSGVDPSLPRRNDFLVIAGRTCCIQSVDPFYVDGELVRLELHVMG